MEEEYLKSMDGRRPANPTTTDESLMADFASGSQAAFELIFERYSSHIINFAYRFLGSRDEAEDIAQEVFLRIYKAKERYDPKRPFRPWIFSIASHLISDQKRFGKRHPKESLDVTLQDSDGNPYRNEIEDRSSAKSEELLEKQQIAHLVQKALKELPENQRQAVLLARFEDMSYEEISQTMKVSVSAVKSLLFRARESLKQSLGACIPEKQL